MELVHLRGSRPEASGGLSGELEFFDAEKSSVFVEGVVNIWQVEQGGTLSDSTELVVY